MKNIQKQTGGLLNTKGIQRLLSHDTFVSKQTGKEIGAENIVSYLQGTKGGLNTTQPPTKQNIKNVKQVDKLTEELVKTCNKILVKRDKECQCFNAGESTPAKDYFKCANKKNLDNNSKPTKCNAYHKCRKIFSNSLSGAEPTYDPNDWQDPLVVGTHNCYMYFLDDQKKSLKKKCFNICKNKDKKNNKSCRTKKQNSCSNLKPQPGDYAHIQGNFKGNRRVYSCPAMVDKVLKDNYEKGTKKSNILHWDHLTHHQQFIKKCPKDHYKGVLVVHPGNTYHFYRQDTDGRYSHKQGTLDIEDVDASNNPIYVPHLADKNYSKGRDNGINYTDFCGYMCIPSNKHNKTHAE
jgi:hypothetical protein